MDVVEGAILKIAAVEPLVRQVDIGEIEARGIESHNLLVAAYVLIDGILYQLGIFHVLDAKVIVIGKDALFVDEGQGGMVASRLATDIHGKHVYSVGHCIGLVKWVMMNSCVGNARNL